MKILSYIKKSSRISTAILLSSCTLLFTECKRTSKDEVALGGDQIFASANFYVNGSANGHLAAIKKSDGSPLTTPNGSPNGIIDFYTDGMYFQSSFSENVTWNLSITGQKSGANKVISGTSNFIDATNGSWNGSANSNPYFLPGEKAVATLSVLGYPTKYSDTIDIYFPIVYDGQIFNGVRYLVVEDFETGNAGGSFAMSSISIDPFDTQYSSYSVSKDIRVSGRQSFYMKSYDSNWNGYLISKSNPDLFRNYGVGEADPSNVYFNLYVYGTGAPSTTVSIEVFEDEHPLPADQFNLAADDRYVADIMVSWTGWKLVSIPYSVFKKARDPKAGGNGNGIRQPELISGTAITLNSYPTAGKTVDAYVDLFVISIGGPFVP